ncbi:hypothetical protein BOTBODRAFT_177939, partial [Botryobasidium botryosum FD-172 SS1]
TPTPRPAQRQPLAPPVPTTTTAIDPQIEVDRTARVVSSLIADLTRVAPGGSPSLTPPLRSLINAFFSAIPMDLLAEAIATNVTLMEIVTPHQAPPPPPPAPAPAKGGKGKKRAPAPAPSKGGPGAPAAPSTTPLPSAAKPKKPTFAEAAKSASASTPGSNPPKFNPSPKVASPMRSKAKDPLSAAFKPLTPIAPEAQASGIAVVEHINRLLAPSHFQLKGCAWSPFGNFIATPHLSEDVAKLPEVLPRILLDMFKVEFRHLTFDNSSFVVVYNLPLGPPGNWADPSTIASALMAQNNIPEPLPASPGRWLANPDRHKGTTASLRLSLSPLMKAAILRSGTLFFDGRPHPVRAFTAAKTKPNQCRQCWRLGHSEAWCRQTNPVCGTCAQGHPSHHHHAVAPNAAQSCVLCKGAHPSWTRWCVNRHIQLAAQPPLPKKKPTKPSAASKRHASKVPAGTSINNQFFLSGSHVPTGVFLSKPPPHAGDSYVIPLLEAVALTGTPVLFVGIDHKNAHLKIFPRFMPPDSPHMSAVYTIQLPEHTIGERAHAAALTLVDAMANMPAHLLMPDVALVIAKRALVDSLVHPNRRTIYHSHLHELASRRILESPRTFHVFVINKWHVLHPPKKAFYYRPPTYVPASFQDHCQSRRVTTRKIKQLLAQSPAQDLEEHIPQDHIFCTFGLIREAIDTTYPTFIALQRPASQTAALARLASGHTFVGSYYKSRNIPETVYSCLCGVDVQDIPHVFLDCPIMAPFKHLLLDDDGDLDTSILFTDKLDSLLEWLKATNAFTKRFGLVMIGTPPPQGSGSLPSPPVLSVVD